MVVLVGAQAAWGTHLGQSAYLRDVHGLAEGPPPPVDLAREKLVGDFVRGLIHEGAATSCHDLSDGGLAVALAEMAIASGIGATVNEPDGQPPVPVFFGEDQARYLVTVPRNKIDWFLTERSKGAGVFASLIGTTGGRELKLGNARAIPVEELRRVHEAWFPTYMDG